MNADNNAEARQRSSLGSVRLERLTLPSNITDIILTDPKLIGFICARHKFVSKILRGKKVLEVGCQAGFGTLLVAPDVKHITCVDFFADFIEEFKELTLPHLGNVEVHHMDITVQAPPGIYEGGFALDVLEHIDPEDGFKFWKNITSVLGNDATFIVGMPSIESQVYASPKSKAGHVNCMSGDQLRSEAMKYFKNVYIFSMNDEVLHTGFLPMSHYILAVCSGKITP